MTSQVIWRGNERHAGRAELTGNQARVAQGTKADCDIGTLLHEIDDGVCQNDVQCYFRIVRQEPWNQGDNEPHADRNVGVHSQVAAWCGTSSGLALRLL